MKRSKATKVKILDFISNFKEIVRKEKWTPTYDAEADTLSYHTETLPADARIRYFGNEIAFYITSRSEIKGIFIEYFLSNFLKHQKNFEDIKKEIIYKSKTNGEIINLSKVKMKKSLSSFELILINSLAESIEFKSNFV